MKNWEGLEPSKSLFKSPDGCGLPIGNLTSQLFSNIYLNVFDQYMKRELGFKHYGRYVDDAYAVSTDKELLLASILKVRDFLRDNLHLELHMGKVNICDCRQGVEFLGAFIKPYRNYISNQSLKRMKRKMKDMDMNDKEKTWRTINSYLGTLGHYKTFKLRKDLFFRKEILEIAPLDINLLKLKRNE